MTGFLSSLGDANLTPNYISPASSEQLVLLACVGQAVYILHDCSVMEARDDDCLISYGC